MTETIKLHDVPDASEDMTFNGDNKSRGKGMIFFYILDFLSRVNMMVLRRDLWPACFFAKNKFFGKTHAASNTQQMLVTGWQDWKLQHPPPVFQFPHNNPTNAQEQRDNETAQRNHKYKYQSWSMKGLGRYSGI